MTIVKFENEFGFDRSADLDRLASVDESGLIVVWDVLQGIALSQVKTNAPINDLAWMPHQQLCRDMFSIIQGNFKYIKIVNANTIPSNRQPQLSIAGGKFHQVQ